MDLQGAEGHYFDGQSTARHDVYVVRPMDASHLEIRSIIDDQLIDKWPLANMRRNKDDATGRQSLYLKDDPDAARLLLPAEVAVDLEKIAPNLDNSDMTGRDWRKIAIWSAGAAGALALIIFVIVPALAGQMARLIPPEREEIFGKTTLHQVEAMFSETEESWFCNGEDGKAALANMTARLVGDQDIPYNLNIQVVDHSMLNAFALPGGQVILMRGLLEQATSADQVAGVLAHELGHVVNRDPFEQALRAAGTAGLLSLILGDATGGTVITLVAENMLNANYTRAAERRADDYAIATLDAANISTEGFAEFFEMLVEEYGESSLPEWASTHPHSHNRADNARTLITQGEGTTPAITETEWAALKSICD